MACGRSRVQFPPGPPFDGHAIKLGGTAETLRPMDERAFLFLDVMRGEKQR